MMANVLEGLVAPKSPGAKCRVPDGSKPGAGSKGPGIGAIQSSCTITSERYPAQSVQGAPVCAHLTGAMLMCSTTPVNSTDSVDENARAERPSRCPPGGVIPRLSTAPRGARAEPHPRQHRGFLSRLGARLRRAGQSSRGCRTPFRSAATVLALLTALTLSLGFVPSAGAQTTTCGTPDLGGRVEVWSAVLTVEALFAGTIAYGYGYIEQPNISGGELSDESFELDSRTVTVTELRENAGDVGISINVNPSLLPSFTSLRLHFCDSALDFADGRAQTNGLFWRFVDNDQPGTFDWSSTSSIAVALSLPSNSDATGHPSIEGDPKLRSMLTAGRGTIDDANGLDDADYSYQWIRIDGTNELDISDAVDATYTTTSDDVDKLLKVVVTFTDDHGYSETRSSNLIGPVTALSCSAPSLGQRIEIWSAVLTVEALFAGTIVYGYGYIEQPNISGGELSDESFELDSRTVTVTELRENAGDIGISINVNPSLLPSFTSLRLHFCDSALDFADGRAQTNGLFWRFVDNDQPGTFDWSSATTIEVALSAPRSPNNPATGTPTITGTPKVGQTLTASTADISDDDGKPSVFEYQWVRVDGSNRTNVGADQRTYTVRDADAGSQIQVEVSFTDDAENEEGPLRSARTDVVTTVNAPPAPAKPRLYASSMQSGSTTELEVQWRPPLHAVPNPPSVDSYDVRYRVVDAQTWRNGPQDVTVTRATITGLVAGTRYEVQVRSTSNVDGNSVWSRSAKGRTRTAGQAHNGDVRIVDGRRRR